MKYMLLIYLDEQKPFSEAERQDCYAESIQLAQELQTNGKYLSANPLHPTTMATSVRVRDGKRFVTDGPFAVVPVLQIDPSLIEVDRVLLMEGGARKEARGRTYPKSIVWFPRSSSPSSVGAPLAATVNTGECTAR